jgi:hypothetical protein
VIFINEKYLIIMTAINRTYNRYWSAISFNGCQDCALMSEQIFAVKPGKTEVEYDVVRDADEW